MIMKDELTEEQKLVADLAAKLLSGNCDRLDLPIMIETAVDAAMHLLDTVREQIK